MPDSSDDPESWHNCAFSQPSVQAVIRGPRCMSLKRHNGFKNSSAYKRKTGKSCGGKATGGWRSQGSMAKEGHRPNWKIEI